MDGERKLNPSNLSLKDSARILTASGPKAVTVETLEEDIGAGAPTNPDGTINLVHYAAWLAKQSGGRSAEPADTS